MNAGRLRLPAVGLVPLLVLAGCLGGRPAEPASSTVAAAADATAFPENLTHALEYPLAMEGHGCNEAGGVSHNTGVGLVVNQLGLDVGVPEPFELADTTEYLGLPARDSGLMIGNAHIAIECEMWTVEGVHRHHANGGWVGLVVKAPPFKDLEPVPRNFLVSTVATQDPVLAEAILDLGFPVFAGVGRVAFGNAGASVSGSGVLETAGDGIYSSQLAFQEQGPAWPVVRLWLIANTPDGKLHPVAVDMLQSGGTTLIGPGVFSHSNTGKHGPPGRADDATGGLGFRSFDFALRVTVLPVELEDVWNH